LRPICIDPAGRINAGVRKVPEKNPSSWIAVWDALPEPARAAIIGAAVSFFRVMYDDKEPRWLRRVFEVALCAALGFTVSYAVTAMGFSSGWGGATDNLTVAVFAYSSNSGGAYDTIGTQTIAYDTAANVTSTTWS